MSPRTSKQFEAIREESRKKIMDAALELFALKGYASTTISNIATKAGVAKGLLYNYFKGKRELLDAIIMDLLDEGDSYFEEMQALESPRAQLKFLVDLSFDFMVDRPEFSKLMTSLALQLDQFPEYIELFNQRYTSHMPLFAHLLEQIGIENHEAEAKAIAAMFDGIGFQYMMLGESYPLDEMKKYLYEKFGLKEG